MHIHKYPLVTRKWDIYCTCARTEYSHKIRPHWSIPDSHQTHANWGFHMWNKVEYMPAIEFSLRFQEYTVHTYDWSAFQAWNCSHRFTCKNHTRHILKSEDLFLDLHCLLRVEGFPFLTDRALIFSVLKHVSVIYFLDVNSAWKNYTHL